MVANGGHDSDDEAIKKKKKEDRARQEVQVLTDFFAATQRKLEQLRQTYGTEHSDLDLSEGEKRILNNIHSAGMMEGVIAGAATLVLLRRFPHYLARRAARRPTGGGYTLEKINSPFQNAEQQQQQQMYTAAEQANSSNNNNAVNRGGLLWRSFQFCVDLTLSFLVAANTSFYMADTEKLKKSVTDIPLMEGRSAISDNFCGILVEEYQRQWNLNPNNPAAVESPGVDDKDMKKKKPPLPPFDRKEILKDPQTGYLQTYLEFVHNCQKRQALERRIRRERGLPPNAPVEIPAPGVSSSSTDWDSDDSDSFPNNTSNENDFYSGETQWDDGDGDDGDDSSNKDEEWTKDDVSNFVSDQEDNSRK